VGVTEPVVVVISADPRASHRAGEAVRIGLGLAASERTVTLVLAGAGVHLLDADGLVDGDTIARFREALNQLGVPFHVDAATVPAAADWNAGGHPVVPLAAGELWALVDGGHRVIVF
jgi:hypothetical protein